MAGKYFYKGLDINELIEDGGTTTPSGANYFTGFPKCRISNLTTNFESCGLEGFIKNYTYQNTSIETPSEIGTPLNSNINKIVAKYTTYTDNSAINSSVYFNTNRVIIPPPFCNHISAVCCGGSGGGGGGGGRGYKSIFPIELVTNGGDGGDGGAGGYAAVERVPVNDTIFLTIGQGGSGEPGGKNASGWQIESGDSGWSGSDGHETILKIGNKTIITANGGGGGSGGGSGNVTSNGGSGSRGSNGNGYVNPNNYGGIAYYENEISQKVPSFDNNAGGGGGLGYDDNSFSGGPSGGSDGNNGFCRIYFLIQ
jgi:hypothetical protein